MNTQLRAIVELYRPRAYTSALRRYQVLIDGCKVDQLRAGETRGYALSPGEHTIAVAMDWYRSKPLRLRLHAGDRWSLECGEKGLQHAADLLSAKGVKGALSAILAPADYLWVRPTESAAPAVPDGAGNPFDLLLPDDAPVPPVQPAARPSPQTVFSPVPQPASWPASESAPQARATPPIFLSYRRDDSEPTTNRIHDRLSARFGEHAIFLDVDSIPVATRFQDEIEKTLRAARVLVLIIGPHWVHATNKQGLRLHQPNDPVRFEIETALALDVPVLPVLVKQANMPDADELPESLAVLPGINYVIMPREPYFNAGMQRLIDAIATLLARGRCCTRCGQALNPEQRFCTHCGQAA